MALTLTAQPTDFGPAYNPLTYVWIRKDYDTTNVNSGSGGVIEIVVTGDITDALDAGDILYLETDNGIYARNVTVVSSSYSAPDTTIVCEELYTSGATSGWINFITKKPLYRLEVDVYEVIAGGPYYSSRDPLLGSFRFSSNLTGRIYGDISAAIKPLLDPFNPDINDALTNVNNTTKEENKEVNYFINYRERWIGNSGDYEALPALSTFLSDPIPASGSYFSAATPGVAWTTGATPNVSTLATDTTEFLYAPFVSGAFIEYGITFTVNPGGNTGIRVWFVFWDADFVEVGKTLIDDWTGLPTTATVFTLGEGVYFGIVVEGDTITSTTTISALAIDNTSTNSSSKWAVFGVYQFYPSLSLAYPSGMRLFRNHRFFLSILDKVSTPFSYIAKKIEALNITFFTLADSTPEDGYYHENAIIDSPVIASTETEGFILRYPDRQIAGAGQTFTESSGFYIADLTVSTESKEALIPFVAHAGDVLNFIFAATQGGAPPYGVLSITAVDANLADVSNTATKSTNGNLDQSTLTFTGTSVFLKIKIAKGLGPNGNYYLTRLPIWVTETLGKIVTVSHAVIEDSGTPYSVSYSTPDGDYTVADACENPINVIWKHPSGYDANWVFSFNQELNVDTSETGKYKRLRLFAENITPEEWEFLNTLNTSGLLYKENIQQWDAVSAPTTNVRRKGAGVYAYYPDTTTFVPVVVIPSTTSRWTRNVKTSFEVVIEYPEMMQTL